MSPFERSHIMDPKIDMPLARFGIGDVVRHKLFDFRGVIFDVDPVFANSEEWYEAIPEDAAPVQGPALLSPARRKCGKSTYVAYVSQQNLVRDESDEPIDHPAIGDHVRSLEDGRYQLRPSHRH